MFWHFCFYTTGKTPKKPGLFKVADGFGRGSLQKVVGKQTQWQKLGGKFWIFVFTTEKKTPKSPELVKMHNAIREFW